jgi:hypothetical protein
MAGSPIKALRRMGVNIANLGDKPPRHDWPPGGRVRVATRIPISELPDDETLAKEIKCVLVEIMRYGGGPEINGRVGAARALFSILRVAAIDAQRRAEAIDQGLARLTAAELSELSEAARREYP